MEPYFKLRPKEDSKGLHQVYLIYSNKGVELRIPMKVKVPKIYWNDGKVIAKIKEYKNFKFDATTINAELRDSIDNLNGILRDFRKKEGVLYNPDVEYVKEKFYSNDVTKNGEDTLYKLFSDYVELKEKKIQSFKRIRAVKKEIGMFLGATYDKDGEMISKGKIDKTFLKDVNMDFLERFQINMIYRPIKGDKEGQVNITVKKKMGVFKAFLKNMKSKKMNVPDDYKDYRDELAKSPKTYIGLTAEEVEKLYKLNLSEKPYLNRIRDKFLIACYTGLRFSDLASITRDSVHSDSNGYKYLDILTQKTDTRVYPPLTPKCEAILDRNSWKLKRISNQRANEFLKELFKCSGIESFNREIQTVRKVGNTDIKDKKFKHELIHFHTSRSFFITESLSRGVPMNEVMRWTGHNGDFKVFQEYIDTTKQGNSISLMY